MGYRLTSWTVSIVSLIHVPFVVRTEMLVHYYKTANASCPTRATSVTRSVVQ